MLLKINALDTLFFRDGKPFTMGDDVWAEGIFPPSPSTLYGAIRTLYAANAGVAFEETEKISISGIYYRAENYNFLATPLDCIYDDNLYNKLEKEQHRKENLYPTKCLKLRNTDDLLASVEYRYIPFIEGGEPIEKALINEDELKGYLKGLDSTIAIRSKEKYLIPEPKIGVGIENDLKAAEESKLYRVGMLRLVGLSILIKVEWEEKDIKPELKPNFIGSVRLGGEGKLVTFSASGDELIKTKIYSNSERSEEIFKICLATPAIIGSNGDEITLNIEQIFQKYQINMEVELVSKVIGKVKRVGGFDMVLNQPKSMANIIPAGSVFYYKLKNGTFSDLLTSLYKNYNSPFIQVDSLKSNEGYGLAYIASINKNQII